MLKKNLKTNVSLKTLALVQIDAARAALCKQALWKLLSAWKSEALDWHFCFKVNDWMLKACCSHSEILLFSQAESNISWADQLKAHHWWNFGDRRPPRILMLTKNF